MSRRLIAVLAALVLFALPGCGAGGDLFGGSGGSGGTGGGGGSMSAGELSMAMTVLDMVNAERARVQVAPLQFHDAATQVAYEHSLDMDVRGFFDHVNPDGEGPCERMSDAGISMGGCGENIAYGYGSPQEVMSGWMSSPGHRANILNAGYTHVGIGVHEGSGGPWWTQDFLSQ